MKTSKAIVLVMAALALSATPALAQRGGGSRGGGSSHSSSMSSSRSSSSSSSSRSSSSFSGSSRSSSSSSRSSSSFSGSSRSSSSPSRSSSSFSGSSRSSSSPSSRSSMGTSRAERGSYGTSRSAVNARRAETTGASRSERGAVCSDRSERGSHYGVRGREAGRTGSSRGVAPEKGVSRTGNGSPNMAPAGATTASGRPVADPSVRNNDGYARPGHPGGHMPPSSRPIHPAPYFHHPWHGYVVHCHPLFWDPLPLRPWYWPGFWMYCNSYWYDYHVTDVVVVRQYVQDTYHVDMVTYGISGDIMYAIVRDGGNTYLQVYDKDDHLLAEQKINRKYCNMVIDSDNGGCWISKKNNKDPLLFIWADGQLLIYEED